jgi:hypothetical protein
MRDTTEFATKVYYVKPNQIIQVIGKGKGYDERQLVRRSHHYKREQEHLDLKGNP